MGTLCNRANQTGSCDCYPITGVKTTACGCIYTCDKCNNCCGPPCKVSFVGPYKISQAPSAFGTYSINCFYPFPCSGCGRSTWKKTNGIWSMIDGCNGSPSKIDYICQTSLDDPDYFYPYATNGTVVYLDCTCVPSTTTTTADPMSTTTTTEEPTTTTYYPMPMVFKYKGDTDRKINNFSRKDIRKRKLNNLKIANSNFQFVVKPLKLNKSSLNKKNTWEYISNLGFFHNYQKFSKKLNFSQWTGKKWINLYGNNNLNLDKIEINGTFNVVFNNDFELIYLSKNLNNVDMEVVNSFFSKLKYDTEVIVEEIRKVKNFNGEWASIKQGDFTDKSLLDFYLLKEKKQFAEFNHENKKELNKVVKFKNISSGVVFRSMSSQLFIGAGSFGLTGNALYISDTHLYDTNGFSMSLIGNSTNTNNSNYYSSNSSYFEFNGNSTSDQNDACGFGFPHFSQYGCFDVYFTRSGSAGCGFCQYPINNLKKSFTPGPFDDYSEPTVKSDCDDGNYALIPPQQTVTAVGSGPVSIVNAVDTEIWPYMDCYIDFLSVVINGKIMCSPTAWACDGDQISFAASLTDYAFYRSLYYKVPIFYWYLNSAYNVYDFEPCNNKICTNIFPVPRTVALRNISRNIDLSKRKKIDFKDRTILSSQQRKIK